MIKDLFEFDDFDTQEQCEENFTEDPHENDCMNMQYCTEELNDF